MKKLFFVFTLAVITAQTSFGQKTFDPALLAYICIEAEYATVPDLKGKITFDKKGGGSIFYETGKKAFEVAFKSLRANGDFGYTVKLTKNARKKGLITVSISRYASFEESLFEMEGVTWYTSLQGAKCGSDITPLLHVDGKNATFKCPEYGCAQAGEITIIKTDDGRWKVKLPDGTLLDARLEGRWLRTSFANIQFFCEGGRKKPRA